VGEKAMDSENKRPDIVFQKGQQIGQYRVVGTLDQGRFSGAYLCQDIQQNKVTIEVLRPPLMGDLQESFHTQTKMLMMLEHPHILRLRDTGMENHYPFLVTDFLPHLTLREVYPHGKTYTLNRVLPYMKQVASALQYAHERNIVHGDVRLENILLNRSNQILLWGFLIEAITQNREHLHYQKSGDKRDSITYTAPEQLQGHAVPESDQYSLAIIIYELLCGVLPFTGSYIEIANQHMRTPPPSLRQKDPHISPKVEQIVQKALEKEPGARFSTVQEFIEALEREQQQAKPKVATARRTPPAQPTGVIAPAEVKQQVARSSTAPTEAAPAPIPAPVYSNKPPVIQPVAQQPPPPVIRASTPPSTPMVMAAQAPRPQTPLPPIIATPAPVDSPPAPRRGGTTMSRRVFAAGLVGLAAAGGAGGWYLLSKRLAKAAPPTTTTSDDTPPATPTSVNNQNALIFTGHLAGVNSVVWSPDGKQLASASDDKFVQIFDAATGKRSVIYSGHTKEVATVAWSPNGEIMASGGQDGTVQVWNAKTGKILFTYKGHKDRVNAVAWSRNSQRIVSGSEDQTVQVWSAVDGTVIFNFREHTAGVLCVGWQPDNSSVASGSWDGTLRDWAIIQHGNHFDAGEQIFSYGGHGKGEVYGLAWSPDGGFIASAGADQTVQISNGIDGTPRKPFFTDHQSKQHVNPVRSVAWSPSGDFIASGDTDGNVYVWAVAGRKTTFIYRGHKKAVNSLAWSPDGKKIASASADNTVHVWQPR
jgi:serine/threonine protein kinase